MAICILELSLSPSLSLALFGFFFKKPQSFGMVLGLFVCLFVCLTFLRVFFLLRRNDGCGLFVYLFIRRLFAYWFMFILCFVGRFSTRLHRSKLQSFSFCWRKALYENY